MEFLRLKTLVVKIMNFKKKYLESRNKPKKGEKICQTQLKSD